MDVSAAERVSHALGRTLIPVTSADQVTVADLVIDTTDGVEGTVTGLDGDGGVHVDTGFPLKSKIKGERRRHFDATALRQGVLLRDANPQPRT